MRASDAERDATVDRLREHFGAGRLTEQELSARIEQAVTAATRQELARLTQDLPEAGPGLPDERRPAPAQLTPAGQALRASLRIHLAVFVLVNVLLVAIWAASGGGYFWPIWSVLGWGFGVAGHAAPVVAGVGRRHDHGGRRELAPSSVGEVAGAVGLERPSLRPAAAPDGTVTILFSDIVGSTELNDRLGDARWVELLRVHHATVREQVQAHGGYEVKVQGDGFMIAFPSARRAVRCALAIREAVTARLAGQVDPPVRLRIGLHAGEAVREGDDFYGRNVVVAARVAAAAEPGEVLATAIVKHLVESSGEVRFGAGREVPLKGLGPQVVHTVEPA